MSRKLSEISFYALLVVLAIMVGATCVISVTSDGADAKRVLESNGYVNIEMTGYKWNDCGRDDILKDGFKATSVNGVSISGVVCSGVFKSSTIRFD